MHVAYLADETKANGRYRGYEPMMALAEKPGFNVRRLRDDEMRCPAGLDALFIHRYCEGRAQGLARDAKARGTAVIWDNDDHQGAMPKSVATHKHFSGFAWERRRAEIQRVFRFTDLVTSPSPILAERLREIGAPQTKVVENYVFDDLLEPERHSHQGVTIGWIAGVEHQMDIERVPIRDALQRLLDERPEVRVVSVGLRLGLHSDRYRAIRSIPIRMITQQAAEFDIAIAPLADIEFSRSRSNVKLKEYAAAGVAWLASPIGPYAGMGEREGGLLVSDDGWYEALGRLIERPRVRRKLAKHGRKWAAGETLSRNVDRWEAALRVAVRHAQDR